MTTDAQKNDLLDQFQAYLVQNNSEAFSAKDQPDLNTLLSEFVELKTEVKAESRQFKNTLDTLSSALNTVQDDNRALAQRLEQQKDQYTRTILLELVDIYDRLHEGMGVLQNYRPIKSMFKRSPKQDINFIKKIEQGQNMTLKHFDKLFQGYQVSRIECINKTFDPTTMNAIETVSEKRMDDGLVVEELRTGFLYNNQVLRLAEVKVNSVKIL